ncbi:MAG: glycosyltransferase [Aquificota bacterium]|nr:MAG: glycosyltransferase [Aquificota bacterium]
MKVLQVVDGYGWGGTKEQVYLTTRELKKKGIDVHIALSFQYKEMVKKLKPYGVPIHYFEDHKKNARYRWENYKRLIKIIDENRFDIVIGNSPHAFDYVRIAKIFLKTKPKIINVKRSGRVPSFLSKYLKYSAADKIVVVSRNVERYLKEKNFLPDKLITIESGIDLSRFKPEKEKKELLRKKLGFPLNKKIFVNVANWNPDVKGQDKLIEAFYKANIDGFLVLVGIDTDRYVPEIAKRFGIEKKVIGLGFRKDVPDILNAADFFVLSSYLEGIAGALLQAMATGKVVLSTLAGGIDEYLKDGENGFSVNVGDFDSLSKKMKMIYDLPEEKYEKISKNAVETAKKYSIEKTAEKYIKLFEEMLNEK